MHELVHPQSNEMVVLDWKSHVYAWSLFADALFYLCESHRLVLFLVHSLFFINYLVQSFVDTTINRNCCTKLISSLNTQPTAAACIAFSYHSIKANGDSFSFKLNWFFRDTFCFWYEIMKKRSSTSMKPAILIHHAHMRQTCCLWLRPSLKELPTMKSSPGRSRLKPSGFQALNDNSHDQKYK